MRVLVKKEPDLEVRVTSPIRTANEASGSENYWPFRCPK